MQKDPENPWNDVTQTDSPWQVQHQPTTGRNRHRRLAGRDPETLIPLPDRDAGWIDGLPPGGHPWFPPARP